MDTASKQKISKETLTLNDITLDQMNLRGRYKTFYPKETEYTFLFLSTYGTFSRMDMLGHKISLNKLKRIEIKWSIFSTHNDMKLEINYNEENWKIHRWKVKVKVAQSCPTLCNPMDYTVHGILQARILEWVTYPFSSGLPDPGTKPRSPALQANSLPTELICGG